ncbi:hypothetical protein [Enterococcus sp. SMC-9]|nr:hypothetical protein [Enterococcus sp. SMC-9]MCD1025839.1 hypothetical protein [Enterococcus sp. SMC-9]
MYSNLEMLFATHILEGKREIEDVPSMLRSNVQEIVDNAKKPEETEQ